MDFASFLPKIGLIYIPIMLALCVHEYAHGWMAKRRGDNTAEVMGRLTLNPIAHIDMMGTVLLPLFLIYLGVPIFFGWAKPVPFNPRNLKNPRVDAFWIALAGPLSNVILAALAAAVLGAAARAWGFSGDMVGSFQQLMLSFVQINLFLAVFNMIPLHPLDGGKVLARFLPARANMMLERNEQAAGLILMLLILMGAFRFLAIPVEWGTHFLLSLALWGMA